MIEALTWEILNKKIEKQYEYDEKHVVGIMLARYGLNITKAMINQNYDYWDTITGKYINVFWAGYGEYLSPCEETPTKTIFKIPGNDKRVYFDLDAFIKIKEKIDENLKEPCDDTLKLVLVNYHDGQLHFDEAVIMHLKENDPNYTEIRDLMTFLTKKCHSEYDVLSFVGELRFLECKNAIKKIELTDIIILGLNVLNNISR